MAYILSKLLDRRFYDSIQIEPAYPDDIRQITLLIVCCIIPYLLFISVIGPRYMAGRKPYELKPLMLVYNSMQIAVNVWYFYIATKCVIGEKPLSIVYLQCLPATCTERLYQLTQYYLWMKLLDLVETCIFVLRKKYNQVSFLHVYHHLIIIWGSYISIVMQPCSIAIILGIANSFVHAIMYSYYFATIYRPDIRTWPLLKKRVTQIQLIQFGYLTLHFGGSFLLNTCPFNKFLGFCGFSQNVYMMFLFGDFYVKSYKTNPLKWS